jgi:hypothetical protein
MWPRVTARWGCVTAGHAGKVCAREGASAVLAWRRLGGPEGRSAGFGARGVGGWVGRPPVGG